MAYWPREIQVQQHLAEVGLHRVRRVAQQRDTPLGPREDRRPAAAARGTRGQAPAYACNTHPASRQHQSSSRQSLLLVSIVRAPRRARLHLS